MANGPPVTELLRAWGRRDRAALEAPIPVVEAQLRRPARVYMACERRGHTLQATALGVSPDTVMRDWRLAKAWLLRELKK